MWAKLQIECYALVSVMFLWCSGCWESLYLFITTICALSAAVYIHLKPMECVSEVSQFSHPYWHVCLDHTHGSCCHLNVVCSYVRCWERSIQEPCHKTDHTLFCDLCSIFHDTQLPTRDVYSCQQRHCIIQTHKFSQQITCLRLETRR